MRFLISILLCLSFMIVGCKTLSEKEKLLEKGTFAEKISYLEKNCSSKDEVVELLGPPDQVENFQGYSSIWHYSKKDEKPIQIVFGRDDTIMRLDVESKSKY